jgi:Protein of unknown function (DUF1553)/Protein of unknown function (DUF1549)/Concanavalin A-like lectin/glucanases superfamily/Planctomycete cytochrome C
MKIIAALLIAGLPALAAEIEFNRDIRPILSDSCFPCHGPDPGNRKTALRFDTEQGSKAELRSKGHAIVPGDPAGSEVFRRITSPSQALRMPPAYAGKAKLSEHDIDLIHQWIEQGAKWQQHWAFIPPKRPAPPAVRDAAWPKNAIDYFVLSRLEREGLKQSPEADRATLLRRVSLDLTGLPPAPAETEQFLRDESPAAYEKAVDRLLASPRYAERMAIRWLEAARYADTNGYQSDGERDMWRWRDWVIDAFRRNMPFDRFTIEQIAGDLLPNATLDQRIATGFQRNHSTSAEGGIVEEEFRIQYVADRAETTSTVWLGLTLGCARCHDHKFDPFKQRDFYRMFAFYNNVPERGLVYNFGNEAPYVKAPTPEHERRLAEFDAKVAGAERRWSALQPGLRKSLREWEKPLAKSTSLDWTIDGGQILHLPLHDAAGGGGHEFNGKDFVNGGKVARFDWQDPFTFSAWINPSSPDGAILSRAEDYWEGEGYALLLKNGKVRLHETLRFTDISLRLETEQPVPLNQRTHVAVTYDGHRKANGVHIYFNGVPQKIKVEFDELTYPFGAKEPFRVGAGSGLRFRGLIDDVRIYNVPLLPEEIATLLLPESINAIAAIPERERTAAQRDRLMFCYLELFASTELREARNHLIAAGAARRKYDESIPTVMVMAEGPPRDAFILKRGAYDAPGDKVTPGVPEVLPQLRPEWPANRLGLARWLVDPGNPLTARVTVNRFWQMLLGVGLVKTVEDFGSQGEWPMHQDLLDWLATEFVQSGWDVKHTVKTIVMSATYRQSSKVTPDLLQRDPENRLLARGPRLRLAPEMIRDQALAISGLLVEKLGGPSVKPYQPPGLWQELAGGDGYVREHGDGLYRRSLYTYWKRTIAPPSMIIFDSPTREICMVRENRTNTPLQALDLMDDVTYVEAARKLAERMIAEGGGSPRSRIEYGWRLALARSPKPREAGVLLDAFRKFEHHYTNDYEAASDLLVQGDSRRNDSLDPVQLAAYTGVASLILNLDETVTKE